MYYKLESDPVATNVYVERAFTEWVSFITGAPLDQSLPVPFAFRAEVDTDEDGNPEEPRFGAYYPEESLMSKPLVAAIQAAGVDNLQTFPAVLTDERTGRVVDDYMVVNVVGLVSCANVDASDAEPLADAYYFHNLVIDATKVGALLMFRLAESQMETIVHERVAEAIRRSGATGMALEPLAEA